MLKNMIRKDKQFILNFAAVMGVGLTMISAIRDTTKACELIDDNMTLREKIKKTWRCYIPSGVIATSTIMCIIYSDKVTMNEKIALLNTLGMVQDRYKDLRESVDHSCNDEEKEEIIKKTVKNKVPKDIYIERTGEKIFYEEYTCNFFSSTIDKVLKAEYLFNKQLSIVGHASLNEFYKLLDIPGIEAGEYLGWSVYEGYYATTSNPWVDFEHSKMQDDDGCEYYYLNYSNHPSINYDMF
jgi:hypothetical protein